MAKTKSLKDATNLVETLLSIKNDKFEVWKYFEDRADRLGERLWSTGTWLMSVLTVIISLPFITKFISYDNSGFPITVDRPIPVILISIFGIAFCLYSYVALSDLREHIEGNWRRSRYALTGKWEEPSWGGRKRSAWNILLTAGICGLISFILLLILSFYRIFG